jgi:glycosyltransferase involved in cell wall biosynthesis
MPESAQLSESGRRILDGHERKPGILLSAYYSNRMGYAWNNIHRLFEVIAREFHGMDYAVWVSFGKLEPPVALGSTDTIDGFLELPGTPKRLREYLLWLRTLRRLGIEVVYLTDQPSWHVRYALFRLAGVRRILVHNRISVADPRPAAREAGARGALKWLVSRLPWGGADRVYAVSDFVKDRLVNKARFPAERVVTILNGVDVEKYSPARKTASSPQLQLFCGGRASPHKGIHVLVDAVKLLLGRPDLPAFRVRYAGDGPELDNLRRQAAAHGLGSTFEFLGQLRSTAEMVREADIVVVPSAWGDACPSTISEALACGKALVATRAGGVPQQVGDPPAALLVEPGDAAQLADAIAVLLRDSERREALGRAARARAEAALDQRRYYEEVIRQMFSDCRID